MSQYKNGGVMGGLCCRVDTKTSCYSAKCFIKEDQPYDILKATKMYAPTSEDSLYVSSEFSPALFMSIGSLYIVHYNSTIFIL